MLAMADIARMEWGGARIAHCRLPAWEAGERESVSATSSIGFAFTTQRRATIEADGRTRDRDVAAGSLNLTGAAPVSWLRVHEPSELIEIAGSSALRRSVAAELGVRDAAALEECELSAGPAAFAIAARFRSALRGGAPLADVERDTLVRLLYANVLRRRFGGMLAARGDGALDAARLARVAEHVEAHLADPLSLEQLGDIAALSPFHFLRSFRLAVGASPHAYVTMRRMERAREMLADGKGTANVAAASGYASRSWFRAAFRRHFGFAPDAVPARGARRWL